MARTYQQSRRGETAEETRRRIVQACFDLHGEQGLVATTMKQIAQRAGVSVGSVYHHFPTYDDAIRACGAHAFALAPIPTAELFQGIDDRAERVRRLALAFYRMFARMTAFGHVVAEQDQLPVVKPFVEEEKRLRNLLAAAAVGEGPRAVMLSALLDHGVYDALRREGLQPDEAAQRIAEVANAWLAASDVAH